MGRLWGQPIKGLSNSEASLYPNPVNVLWGGPGKSTSDLAGSHYNWPSITHLQHQGDPEIKPIAHVPPNERGEQQKTFDGPGARTTYCITKDSYLYPILMAFGYKYSKLIMTMFWQAIRDSLRSIIWCAENSTGQIFENLCQTMSSLVTSAEGTKRDTISLMDYSNSSQSHLGPGNPSQWISLNNYPHQEAIQTS